jgi:hypothetical protein
VIGVNRYPDLQAPSARRPRKKKSKYPEKSITPFLRPESHQGRAEDNLNVFAQVAKVILFLNGFVKYLKSQRNHVFITEKLTF